MKKKLTCTNYFRILEKKRFSREHTKNPNGNVRARPDVTYWAVGYHPPPPPPPRVPASFSHMLNMRTHLRAKGLVGTRGGMMF